jgi:anti-sigma factor RsiW
MNDCPNADIRDQLPDLLHERLDASARAAVMVHVDACVDCRAELELLRSIHAMLVSQAPRVDVDAVVRALPTRVPRPVRVASRRRVWTDWRIAAAVTVLAVGGGSFAVIRQSGIPTAADSGFVSAPPTGRSGQPATDTSAPQRARVATDRAARSGTSSPQNSAGSADDRNGLGTTAHLADLNERQLQALLDQIDQLQAVPMTDPEPVTIRIDNKHSSPEGA